MVIDDYDALVSEKRPDILFERCYDYLSGYRDNVTKIMKHNADEGRFAESLRKFIRQQTYAFLVSYPSSKRYRLSDDKMAEHFANTIQMILGWCFMRKDAMNKEEALDALHYLLGGIQ